MLNISITQRFKDTGPRAVKTLSNPFRSYEKRIANLGLRTIDTQRCKIRFRALPSHDWSLNVMRQIGSAGSPLPAGKLAV